MKRYLTGFLLSALMLSILPAVSLEIKNITDAEENSGYFRRIVFSHLTDSQILLYLKRKEIAEKTTKVELGAKYLQGQFPPYDRKLDPFIGKQWEYLTSAEKEQYKLRWFKKNKDTVTLQDMQLYININDLVKMASNAEAQRIEREHLQEIDLSDITRNLKPAHPQLAAKKKKKTVRKVSRRRVSKRKPKKQEPAAKPQPEASKVTIIIPKLEIRSPQTVQNKYTKEKRSRIDYVKDRINSLSGTKNEEKSKTPVKDVNTGKLLDELRRLKEFKIGE